MLIVQFSVIAILLVAGGIFIRMIGKETCVLCGKDLGPYSDMVKHYEAMHLRKP